MLNVNNVFGAAQDANKDNICPEKLRGMFPQTKGVWTQSFWLVTQASSVHICGKGVFAELAFNKPDDSII